MPVSVATRTEPDDTERAAVSIPPVDKIRALGSSPAPACHSAGVAQPHSGWMNSGASG